MSNANFGETFKMIRESRGLSQDYVTNGIVSRTSLSKIENGKQTPTITNAFFLIERLDLELNEFFYIQNNYQYNSKSSIIQQFINLSESTQTEPITNLINECTKFLSNNYDIQINNILLVLQSLRDLENGEDFNKVKERLIPVWERLSNIDNWLTIDLFLINNILYFFPFDTAYNMTFQALKTLEYKYPYLLRLKNAFYLNIAYLLMNENLMEQATEFLNKSIDISKTTKRYDLLLLAKIRLSIIAKNSKHVSEYCNLLVSIGAESIAVGVRREMDIFLIENEILTT